MNAKLLNADRERTYAVVFDEGEEVTEGLRRFAEEEGCNAARLTGIGAFRSVVLAWFNLDTQEYEEIPIDEQVEVLSLVGNIAEHEEKPKLHVHLVVGKRDGTAHGGHLVRGVVRPTLEVMLIESPRYLRRRHDPKTGLALIDPEDSSAAGYATYAQRK
ncbi:MAG: DNA-binding protein [Planctomycetes bacterium]|nr:DNA-binding protein [Planctomycetota bacterium]